MSTSATLDGAQSGDGREVYRLPAISGQPELLLGFYRAAMPPGEPYNGLEWCGEVESDAPASTIEWVWRSPGSDDFLVLGVSSSSEGDVVSITDEQGNPERTC